MVGYMPSIIVISTYFPGFISLQVRQKSDLSLDVEDYTYSIEFSSIFASKNVASFNCMRSGFSFKDLDLIESCARINVFVPEFNWIS